MRCLSILFINFNRHKYGLAIWLELRVIFLRLSRQQPSTFDKHTFLTLNGQPSEVKENILNTFEII